ncbi:dTDP-4-dehydrorhamnose 3,5-epimerase [Neisseria sp. HSC-16F19]|nr:dTDP-4-dehydrorhamnose 3,5-epimerase [Neisseria sp. HSC-16F19]MCP2039940.1 dTDP-4-dehydrorhamnose 3,5-epimerase [Neisseria sp. HSC-16F19]
MQLSATAIADVKIIRPVLHTDTRGWLMESHTEQRYRDALGLPDLHFVQDNVSHSKHGVLRGLHFQRSHPQGKLVTCVSGEIFDVVVDIRPASPTYGRWVGVYLRGATQLWVPPGLAHGFAVTGSHAVCVYKCTDYYHPADEGCLLWNDAAVGIDWPLAEPLVSDKDRAGLPLAAL